MAVPLEFVRRLFGGSVADLAAVEDEAIEELMIEERIDAT